MSGNEKGVRQWQKRRDEAYRAAYLIAERAAHEGRSLTDLEQRQFDSYTANLDYATREQQALLANGRDPHEVITELEGKRQSSTPGNNHLQQRLEIQKRLGERTSTSITLHDANMRDRQLNSAAAAIEQHQRAAEWSATLSNQARRAELNQALIDHHETDNS